MIQVIVLRSKMIQVKWFRWIQLVFLQHKMIQKNDSGQVFTFQKNDSGFRIQVCFLRSKMIQLKWFRSGSASKWFRIQANDSGFRLKMIPDSGRKWFRIQLNDSGFRRLAVGVVSNCVSNWITKYSKRVFWHALVLSNPRFSVLREFT